MKELKQVFEASPSEPHTENFAASEAGTVGLTPESIEPRCEAHPNPSSSSAQTEGVARHPLSDLFGKYDGDIWDEVFAEIDADRQKDTAGVQK